MEQVEIILVEDTESDGELCLRALKSQNVANRVVWLKDGAEALDYIFGRDTGLELRPIPRLILLDLRLPKVTGFEVLRRLKSDERTRRIPVVVLTSSREDRDIVESYELGVNSYVTKPVSFEVFSRTVAQLGYYWLAVNEPPAREP
jgi:two-component system, response regulator